MKKNPCVYVSLVIIFMITGQVFAQGIDFRPKIDSLFSSLDVNNKFMGTAAIIDNGVITWSRAVGYADVETEAMASTSTKYRIGSITKMFTSVMIYQLFEEKKLKPQTKLAVYFPELPNAANISINDMLLHQSGLWSVTDDSLYLEWCVNPKSRKEIFGMMKDHESLFNPGEKSEYSNSNYILLGYIIEDITGNDYATNLKERIIGKIGLKSTVYGGKIMVLNNEALSYSTQTGSWEKENETEMPQPD